jgi:phenylpropionate dioxygenase-like ring-hydroxylating dioxygenase large terminal subunit
MRNQCGRLNEAWYAAAESRELSGRTPVAVVILGEQLVLWRDSSGQAHSQLDRCLHRNSLLSEGTIIGDSLACPYHGWVYNGDGHCTHVPSMGPDSSAPAGLHLENFTVCEQDGLVWVWMGYAPPQGKPFCMLHFGEPGWGNYYMKTRFGNDVTNLVENFMDVPHTVFVHAGWFRKPARRQVMCLVESDAERVCITYEDPNDSIGDGSGLSSRILNPNALPLVHTDQFFMPNTTRVDYIWGQEERAFVISSTCSPVSEIETWVYTNIAYKLPAGILTRPLAAVLKRFLPWYTRRVIGQDVDIMKIQRLSLDQHGGARFHETGADLPHLHIEALREWAAGDQAEPPPKTVRENMAIWI